MLSLFVGGIFTAARVSANSQHPAIGTGIGAVTLTMQCQVIRHAHMWHQALLALAYSGS